MTKSLGNQNSHSFVVCFKELTMSLENHEKYQDAHNQALELARGTLAL